MYACKRFFLWNSFLRTECKQSMLRVFVSLNDTMENNAQAKFHKVFLHTR